MNSSGLDFEAPILELERKIEELKKFTSKEDIDLTSEIKRLEEKLMQVKKEIFENLTPWQRVQVARHPKRPLTLDYISMITSGFLELHGDRHFGDDPAMVTGFAKLDQYRVLIVGHQKGKDTKENLYRNFGSAHPEGYRKAMRLMKLAEKFGLPIIAFVDTPGAYPGIGAEERGQSEAIAYNLREMMNLAVPIIVTVIGEGGSGGALGIGVGDKVCVLESSYYSVISPEGCASILWRSAEHAQAAAEAGRITSDWMKKLGVVDAVVTEPLGGAHRDPNAAIDALGDSFEEQLQSMAGMDAAALIADRQNKYLTIGDSGLA